MKIIPDRKSIILIMVTLVIGVMIGLFINSSSNQQINESSHQHNDSSATQDWTCSMHPQIRQQEPGNCPLCGMELIPVNVEESDDNPMAIRMSPTAMQLANVQTSIITKKKPLKEVRLNGKVQADERYVFSQTSHISGRIEQLLVNYTGESVSKGQVIAYIYSPELVTAQEELFEAYKIRDTHPTLYKAAREKLKNWKLADFQIDGIIESGTPEENFPILSDLNGIVLTKRVNLGDHIKQGSSLFEIANLSKVWVLFDVYESEMPWVKMGDEVDFTIQSLPGEKFKGKVSFIDPVINPKTRVVKARIAMQNPSLRLKPEMFVSGLLKSHLKNSEPTIIVPKSAVMWTGERSIVYVKTNSTSGISFIMKEVTLGPALGDSYIVTQGLEEGEELATNGTFSIDAAAQLAGKPSMMNPEGGMVMTGHKHGSSSGESNSNLLNDTKSIAVGEKIKQALLPLFEEYMKLKDALVNDDFDNAITSGKNFQRVMRKINMALFKGESHAVWMTYSDEANEATNNLVNANNIETVRFAFINLSEQIITLGKKFKPTERTLFIQFCPMADDFKGAYWISNSEEIRNPFFGASMLTCGEVKQEIK